MKSPCVGPENAPSSDVFGHNPNRPWQHENAGRHFDSCAAHDFRGGLHRSAFHGRPADDARGGLNAPCKHLGDDEHAFNRSIPALHQRAGCRGGIPDCFSGLGRGNFPAQADVPRQRIAAPRSRTGLTRSKR